MFSKFSVKRPLTIFVSVILTVILGIVSFTGMTTDLLPKMDLPYVVVITTYPGASPEKVELGVTKPLEKVLATTSGIENINSISSENSSMIILEFSQDMNMDSAMIDLSGKIDLVKSQLDDEVGSPMLMKLNPDMMPIMVASVDVDGLDIKEVSKYVKDEVITEFERIDGVASVDTMGILEESIGLTLDSEKIDAINNKVLKSIDSKLAETKSQLDSAKAQIKEGKDVLAKESQSKTEELINGGNALEEGKDQIKNAINNLPQLQKDLETQRKDLVSKKDALIWAIEQQEQAGMPVTEEQQESLSQLEEGIASIDKGIEDIQNQKPTLESSLKDIIDKQKQLEMGKVTLNQELTKASVNLSNSEAQLEESIKKFEESRDEAYKNANISGMLTKDTISKILMAQNFSMPAGYISQDGNDYIVKVGDKVKDIKELENLVLFNIDVAGIGDIKLKDVAKVEMIDNSDDIYAKINGNDGIILTFQKQSTASTSEVSDKINETIENLTEENKDMHITALQDQGIYIDMVVNSVLSNLVLGGILAVIILFVFLRSVKPTIIIAFSIPISLLFALTLMYFSGITLNMISLSGLALGVGMLVDNSIVVIENTARLRNKGMNVATASVKGASQVAGAIFASTLTTVCVFLPIVFTKGIARQLFEDMGLTIAYSLLASLIVALTLVPAMFLTMNIDPKEKEDKFFDKIINIYEKLLRSSLKHKFIVLALTVILLVSSTFLVISKGTTLMPISDSTQISISMEMPKESTQEDTRNMSDKIIDKLATIDDIETIGAIESSGGMMSSMSSGSGNISFYVLLKEDKKLTSQEIGYLITEKTSDLDCKISVNTSTMDMSALGGSGVEVIIKGKDLDKLQEISTEIADIVSSVNGTIDVSNGLEDADKETRITVNKSSAMKYGLTVAQVYQEISTALKNETTATTLELEDYDYPVVLINSDEDKLKKSNLENFTITATKDGEEEKVKISDIATIKEEESLSSISHKSQNRSISVTAGIDSSHNIGLVSKDIEEKLKDYDLPDGYSIDMGGEQESINSAFGDLIKMITLAIVFIYLIMVAQFQSLLSPFIVLFTIPLAFTGGFLGLLITGTELSMISLLGFLILSGIVVNNGIVFVDYVNQLRLDGMNKKEALVLAGKTRIRPILMTALTTILGLSTMALGVGMGADLMQPMAIVTIGGLSYATILTLFIVPIMYDILHRRNIKKVVIEEDEM